jgi:hypothetical protein
MGDFQRVAAGDKKPFKSARVVNAILDVAEAHARGGEQGSAPSANGPEDSITVLVRNETAGDVPRFGILEITEPLILPTDSEADFKSRQAYVGYTPSATSAVIVVMQEATGTGKIGRGVVLGSTVVNLTVGDASHTHAAPTADTGELTTGVSGPALIAWKESGTGSGKLAKVILRGLTGGERPPETILRGSGSEAEGGTTFLTATISRLSAADGTRTSGGDCWLVEANGDAVAEGRLVGGARYVGMRDGVPVYEIGCCCECEVVVGDECPCPDNQADGWFAFISGVEQGIGVPVGDCCVLVNGFWDLCAVPEVADCAWCATHGGASCEGEGNDTITICLQWFADGSEGPGWYLRIGILAIGYVDYFCPAAEWVCDGPSNTLTKFDQADGFYCAFWPDTITVGTPATC